MESTILWLIIFGSIICIINIVGFALTILQVYSLRVNLGDIVALFMKEINEYKANLCKKGYHKNE